MFGKQKKYKEYDVRLSMGHDTKTDRAYTIEARDEQQAYFLCVPQYEVDIGVERLKEIFKMEGLPSGYSPYSVIELSNK